MATIKIRTEVTGSVWKITSQNGQKLAPGDTIMILESMKMEIPVIAEDGGTVTEVLVAEGEAVNEGQHVATLSE
jgi:acetyl-CoA carboxylase biotin carboxyl carrier protein